MRWRKFDKLEPADGQLRYERWFAFLPVTIGDEVRWLEWVTVVSQYNRNPLLCEGYWKMLRYS